jgi:uncharacterized protein YciI
VDFFVYSRDAPGTAALRGDARLAEAHWSYMDEYAESMIARGPTLARDRETATGSLHVLGLPSVDAALEFVAGEPNNRAGVYAEHSVWRFENLLGRTMWEFEGAARDPKFLVIARPQQGGEPAPLERISAELRERMLLYGSLTRHDDAGRVGVAATIEARDREAAGALLRNGGLGLAAFPAVELHDWELGGRR